jgi:hypothetical protein
MQPAYINRGNTVRMHGRDPCIILIVVGAAQNKDRDSCNRCGMDHESCTSVIANALPDHVFFAFQLIIMCACTG